MCSKLYNIRTKAKVFGKTIYFFKVLNSTNDKAREMYRAGAEEGTVVLAETQTQGRGTKGRRWVSPKGGIYLSIIFSPRIETKDLATLPCVLALGVIRAIVKTDPPIRPTIKWPNDVYLGKKKVAGILVETETIGGEVKSAILGVGINLNTPVALLPKNATSLSHLLKREIDFESFLGHLLLELEDVCLGLDRKAKKDRLLSELKIHLSSGDESMKREE
jgi:BirA family biotin operon repressor/biotin-[acetyl-CoA-carboxylase] ligase